MTCFYEQKVISPLFPFLQGKDVSLKCHN
jgi:hypothetical protein